LASNVWWITPCKEHDEFSHPFWVVWFCNECDAVWLTRMEAFKLTSYYYSVVDNYHMLIQHSGLMATGQVLLNSLELINQISQSFSSVFLSRQISEQYFQPWLISQANRTCIETLIIPSS
jgi:hypothetical protein